MLREANKTDYLTRATVIVYKADIGQGEKKNGRATMRVYGGRTMGVFTDLITLSVEQMRILALLNASMNIHLPCYMVEMFPRPHCNLLYKSLSTSLHHPLSSDPCHLGNWAQVDLEELIGIGELGYPSSVKTSYDDIFHHNPSNLFARARLV